MIGDMVLLPFLFASSFPFKSRYLLGSWTIRKVGAIQKSQDEIKKRMLVAPLLFASVVMHSLILRVLTGY